MRAVTALLVVKWPRTAELVLGVVPIDKIVEQVVRAMTWEALHDEGGCFLLFVDGWKEIDTKHVVGSVVIERCCDGVSLHRQVKPTAQ